MRLLSQKQANKLWHVGQYANYEIKLGDTFSKDIVTLVSSRSFKQNILALLPGIKSAAR
jgi:hypothetical protein